MAYKCATCKLVVPVRVWPFTCVCGTRYESADAKGVALVGETPGRAAFVEGELPAVVRSFGPGTEQLQLMAALRIVPTAGCDCKTYARRMDIWGVTGCRERLEEIVAHIDAKRDKYGISDTWRAGLAAITSGLFLRINPLDPVRSLVLLAIERAAAKESTVKEIKHA